MTRHVLNNAPEFFDFAFFDQTGVQSGTRTFTKTTLAPLVHNFFGYLIEIAQCACSHLKRSTSGSTAGSRTLAEIIP